MLKNKPVEIISNNTSKAEWCWWCRHPSQEMMGCPITKTTTYGWFCSPECTRAFIQEQKDIEFKDSLSLLLSHKEVRPAPHFTLLKEYGGSLSIEEFRRGSTEYIPLNGLALGRQFRVVKTMF